MLRLFGPLIRVGQVTARKKKNKLKFEAGSKLSVLSQLKTAADPPPTSSLEKNILQQGDVF